MNEITKAAKAILAKRKEIASIKLELERCAASIAVANDSSETLAALGKQRQDVLSAAFMAGTQPDTTDVDKLIKAAEKTLSAASDTIAGAVGARDVLRGQFDQAETELSGLIESAQRLVRAECQKRFEEAERAYSEAVQGIGNTLAEMIGLLKVTQRVGGYGDMRTALRDYVHSSGGLVERRDGRIRIAEWRDRIDSDLGNNQETKLLREFEAAGFNFPSLAGSNDHG